jgi:hypothetical protein
MAEGNDALGQADTPFAPTIFGRQSASYMAVGEDMGMCVTNAMNPTMPEASRGHGDT